MSNDRYIQSVDSSDTFYLILLPSGKFLCPTGETVDFFRATRVRDFQSAMSIDLPDGAVLAGCQLLTTREFTVTVPGGHHVQVDKPVVG